MFRIIQKIKMVEKTVKVYFCPQCKSEQVGYVFRFGNAFGVIPKMECKKCKYCAPVFPQWVIGQKELDKLNKKAMKKINEYLCPKCKSKNWKMNASDAIPTDSKLCADCG